MSFARLDQLLSLGLSSAMTNQLARRIRVANALALLGVVLSVTGLPVDAIGAPFPVLIVDVVCIAAFSCCWVLNARRFHTAARVVLMMSANGVMLGGVIQIGDAPELRTVFFPLAIMPFLVFLLEERGWLAGFVTLPVACYFVTAKLALHAPGLALSVNVLYAPLMAFTMLVAGTYVYAHVDRATQENLLRARERTAQGVRLAALGELSSSIAHEIRNPLAAIHLAATQIASHPGDAAQVAQLGERVLRIVMRATRIIDALRSFSRDASGDPFVTAPVERILADTLELCGKRISDEGVELTLPTAPTNLVIECRPVQLTQVLVNLVSNAYDAAASSSDRSIRIELATVDNQLELSVTDSGAGVPPDVRDRIFEPFFSTKAVERGTGLGLSLSRSIVEAHRGMLDLDTASPHTRFVIRIPVTQMPS